MSDKIYAGTAKYNLIYIFAIHDADHEGYLKIGEHSFDSALSYKQLTANCAELQAQARARIDQYTKTAMTQYELLHVELARKQIQLADGTIECASFRDHDVHTVLDRSGYDVRRYHDTDRPSEWYKVGIDQAIAAIRAVKLGRNTLTAAEKAGNLHSDDEDLPAVAAPAKRIIILRDEQKACIAKTKKAFKNSDRMLWDCKMRFGKTVTAYSLVKEMQYQKVIVVTHRPAVVDGWRSDFDLIFGDDNRTFVTKANIKDYDRITTEDLDHDAENDRILGNLVKAGTPFVYFASMQDLRGSKVAGGKFDKNRAVFDMDWDIIIYDEAHEGTQTELGLNVQKLLEKPKAGKHPKKVLQLSGTPYNILDQYDDDNVYSWDYVMEQRSKKEWDEKHPGDHNPYGDLPEMVICTFDLRNKMQTSYRYEDENIAFNFREFFRTWTGDPERDFRPLPAGVKAGDFVHRDDVWQFLNLISTESDTSNYPFATAEYRDMFKHTFWILPGVKEARAFSAMLKEHPVFGAYEIVNVAGEGDVEQPYDDALQAVRKAIKENPYTITLSCGKLTTGVTVKEWTGVMLLSGSASTGAAGYMQTIFRVQSAGSIDGKQKTVCYAFDFAPDRTLKVLSDVHSLKRSAVGTDDKGRVRLGEFLNFCPVLAEAETGMEFFDVPKMMKQLKKLTVDAAVKSGFDDDSIYKADAGIVMDRQKLQLFDMLKSRLNPQKKGKKDTTVTVNDTGLTDEQYKKAQGAKHKPKKERSKEEQEALDKEREMKKKQQALFDLLRNISIRLPLLIYGTATEFDETIKLADFITIVDDASWKEFMPKEVDKALFRKLLVFYDEDVIEGAGMRIRRLAKAADELMPTQRVLRIAEIISHFKNPAKETVLTPWRVVNMHMGDTIGGYNFYKEGYPEQDGVLEAPRLIEQGEVTADLFLNKDVKVLEMNSKSGLYPLYVAYSIYRMLLPREEHQLTLEEAQGYWQQALSEHLFVLCQTKMAVSITQRTLAGYNKLAVNAIFLPRLLERMADQKRLANKLTNPQTWNKDGEKMKFDAIVGNPPYQEMDGGNRASASPIYQHFISAAISLQPQYISMITPSRWFAGGKGLDEFRANMLSDERMERIVDYADSSVCFKGVDIAGGVNYFLWNLNHTGNCTVTSVRGNESVTMERKLDEYDIFIRNNASVRLLDRLTHSNDQMMDPIVGTRNTFGISTDEHGQEYADETHTVKLACSQKGNQLMMAYIDAAKILKGHEFVNMYKVVIGRSVPRNGEVGVDPSVGYRAITTVHIFGPNTVFTDTYLLLAAFATENEAEHFAQYMTLKLPRFLLHETYTSMAISKDNFRFVPYLDYTESWNDEKLYSRYECTQDEIKMIESLMRPLEYVIHSDDGDFVKSLYR